MLNSHPQWPALLDGNATLHVEDGCSSITLDSMWLDRLVDALVATGVDGDEYIGMEEQLITIDGTFLVADLLARLTSKD